jgi:hypothetical protein
MSSAYLVQSSFDTRFVTAVFSKFYQCGALFPDLYETSCSSVSITVEFKPQVRSNFSILIILYNNLAANLNIPIKLLTYSMEQSPS